MGFKQVILDATAREMAIARPTDSRRLGLARNEITRLAKRAGLTLEQTSDHEATLICRHRLDAWRVAPGTPVRLAAEPASARTTAPRFSLGPRQRGTVG